MVISEWMKLAGHWEWCKWQVSDLHKRDHLDPIHCVDRTVKYQLVEELQLPFPCPAAADYCVENSANDLSNFAITSQVHNKSVGMTFGNAPSLLLLSSQPTLTESIVIKRLQEALELSLNLRGNWYKHEMTYGQKHCMSIPDIRE